MLRYHGPIGGGKFGVMNTDQIKSMLPGKYAYGATKQFESSLSTRINHGQSDGGTATGDCTYDALPIRRTSMGAGENGGCTLFDLKQPGNIARVVGVGYHAGARTCKVLRVEGGRIVTGGTLSLDK